MSKIAGLGKVYALGHREAEGITTARVEVTEKLDGSQFSFSNMDGELHIRSKKQAIQVDQPPKMFKPAVETVVRLHEDGLLVNGGIYRGEAFRGPKHNHLKYDRTPRGNIVLYGVDWSPEVSAWHEEIARIAERFGVDSAPLLFSGIVTEDIIDDLLKTESFLGGPKIEGIVIRSHHLFNRGRPLRAKVVSEAFKETMSKPRRKPNRDGIQSIADSVSNSARWSKAAQSLEEQEKLTGTPRDIGPIVNIVKQDIMDECLDDIKEMLFDEFHKDVMKAAVSRIHIWYKDRLAKDETAHHEDENVVRKTQL